MEEQLGRDHRHGGAETAGDAAQAERGAEREQGGRGSGAADEPQGLLDHARQREAAQAVEDAEHGRHDDRVHEHRARGLPTTCEPTRPPLRRLSSSSTVTELNTITSNVMISSAGTPPASPYSHSSSGSASMTPLEKAEPNAWMVISAMRMPNTSRPIPAPAMNTMACARK